VGIIEEWKQTREARSHTIYKGKKNACTGKSGGVIMETRQGQKEKKRQRKQAPAKKGMVGSTQDIKTSEGREWAHPG